MSKEFKLIIDSKKKVVEYKEGNIFFSLLNEISLDINFYNIKKYLLNGYCKIDQNNKINLDKIMIIPLVLMIIILV